MPWGRCCSLTIKHVTGPVELTTDTNPDGSTTVHIHTWEPDTVAVPAITPTAEVTTVPAPTAEPPTTPAPTESEPNPSHVEVGGFKPIQGETGAELPSTTHSPADTAVAPEPSNPTTVEEPPPFDPDSLPPLAA